MPPGSGAQAIAAGGLHTCAAFSAGLECWGHNSYGELGNQGTVQSNSPVPVANISAGVQAIADGAWHSCALVDGGALCWGTGTSGQLGNGGTSNVSAPVQVSGLTSGVSAIATGYNHTCALVNGAIQCWGDGAQGQLGTMYSKDDATAFNAKKKGVITGKGVLNNRISEYLMLRLAEIGVPTHFVRRLNMREQLIREVEIIPLEVVVRNVAAGSLSERLGISGGHPPAPLDYR